MRVTTCQRCHGAGEVPASGNYRRCSVCHGHGTVSDGTRDRLYTDDKRVKRMRAITEKRETTPLSALRDTNGKAVTL